METHWSDSDFSFPDDPFDSVTIGGDAPAFAPFPASTQPEPLPPAPNAGWGWHDAAIIALERNDDPAAPFEIGAIDLYTDPQTGDLGGSYLPIGRYGTLEQAGAAFEALHDQIDQRQLPAFALPAFAEAQAAQNGQAVGWRSADAAEYAAYDALRGLADDPAWVGQDSRAPDLDDGWEGLADFSVGDAPPANPWALQQRQVETPDGQPLGTALVLTETPPTDPARTLELAHFTDAQAAERFEQAFRRALVPGVMDGPELAPVVAQLEGLSGVWEPLPADPADGLPTPPLIRERADWHPHDPHAARTAQARSEGRTGWAVER